jgi:beta-mannosidase
MRISLNGNDWSFKGFLDAAWQHEDAIDTHPDDALGWHVGTVPGSVQHDLWQCGEVPDPYWERNSLLLEWVPERTWVYTKSFVVDGAQRGNRVRLCFTGVDYEAQFFLNGTPLGAHSGMFTPATFEVSKLLRWDAPNVLAVVIAPAPREQGQLGRTSMVRTHKTRMNYWWDFCPRTVHLGIWDDVYLEWTGVARIEDVWARPRLNDDFSRANITVAIKLSSLHQTTAVIETSIEYAGHTVASRRMEHDLLAGETDITLQVEIDDPQVWWPNGYGEPALYQATVRVVDQAELHEVSDQQEINFGIRRVELVPNDTPDTTAPPYTFVVNGVKLYITGWNWVPIDVLYGVERPAKLERLLTLAQRAHVNLLRVWGGGLIEKECFYDLCDRLGIMVWQEFILSSSAADRKPSEDPQYITMMVKEAQGIIPRKRNHPSLVIWCGGNELESLNKLPLDDREPVLAALRDVIKQLDPDRHWLSTSALGRKPFNGLSSITNDPHGLHDVHGPWHYGGLTEQYTLYNAGTSLLHSEFGAEGLTNLKTLNAIMSPAQRWPPMLRNPVWQHLGAWWVREANWHEIFGPINDLPTLVRATQFLQAEGVRYAIESNRRRMYQNSGSLPWQFNEPYPMAACTSAVDYYAQPKALYHAVARAYEPLHITAKFPTLAWAGKSLFEAEVWVTNALEQAFEHAVLETRIIGASGKVYQQQRSIFPFGANSATYAAAVQWPLAGLHEDIFFLDLRLTNPNGTSLSINRYLFSRTGNLQPMLALLPTTLAVHKEDAGEDWTVTVTNTGDHAALFVRLEDGRDVHAQGYAYFDRNHFCLLPGEQRTVAVEWKDVAHKERCVAVEAWNVDRICVS